MRSPGVWPPAKGRSWVVGRRPGVWRRRPWPTSIWRWTTTFRSFPVINKIDLPSADPERVKREIEDVIGLDGSQAILASAKNGTGIEAVLEGIVANFPPPPGGRRPCAAWSSIAGSIPTTAR